MSATRSPKVKVPKFLLIVAAIALFLIALPVLITYPGFKRDMHAAHERLSKDSRILRTGKYTIEYSVTKLLKERSVLTLTTPVKIIIIKYQYIAICIATNALSSVRKNLLKFRTNLCTLAATELKFHQ